MAFDPFRYDPFSSAAPARRPAPAQRLSYEELLASLQQQFQPAPRPEAARSIQDLDPGARRGVRQDSIVSALASLGASMQTNDWRYAGAGAGQIAEIERAGVADANASAETAWQRQQEDAAQAYQQQAKEREVAALHGMYEEVLEGEDPAGPWAERAATAARAGSMSELGQMREARGKRAFIRSKGMDPDAWDANQRAEAELKAEIERANAAAAQAGEMERRAEQARVDQEAKLAQEEEMRKRGLGSYAPPQYEPLDRVAARERLVQGIRAEHAAKGAGGAASRRIVEANGVWGVAEIGADGELVFKPGKGQPQKQGEMWRMSISVDGVETPFMADPKRPELGWYPMKVNPTGTLPAAPIPGPVPGAGGGGAGAASPPPGQNAKALGLRNEATVAILKGGDPQRGLAALQQRLGPDGRIDGYTAEQIIEEAKAQARKLGWKG